MILVAPNKIIIDSVKSITGKLPAHIIFQTYQYLSRNIDRTKIIANGIKHILIDEFHHAGAFTWSKAIHELMLNADNPHVLGFSATPERDNDDIDVASMFLAIIVFILFRYLNVGIKIFYQRQSWFRVS